MALIKCKECGKEISGKAKICPHCGLEKNKKKRIIITSIIIIGIVLVTLGIVKVFLVNGGIGNTIKKYETKQKQKEDEKKAEEEIKPYIGSWKLVKSEVKGCYDEKYYSLYHYEHNWIKEDENRYCYTEKYSDTYDCTDIIFPKEKINLSKDNIYIRYNNNIDFCPVKYEICYDVNKLEIWHLPFILKDNQLISEHTFNNRHTTIIYERAN